MNSEEHLVRYKMILFGNAAVGKTSLLERFVNDKFEENYMCTLGYNVYEKLITHTECTISLVIYDIGGQEGYRDLRKRYAQGAHTAFIIYDITNQDSFTNIIKWKSDLIEFAGKIPFIVIGNKMDLKDKKQVSKDKALTASVEMGALAFFETSAKTGEGVEDAFRHLAIKTYELSKT
ncbi:MAG TPA: Rab family GTPase [Candidatus Deferrimicrobium sp.]|nr:Rab family GTPase [Candidatus Deferrimicrobium sp.]